MCNVDTTPLLEQRDRVPSGADPTHNLGSISTQLEESRPASRIVHYEISFLISIVTYLKSENFVDELSCVFHYTMGVIA